MKKTSGKQPIKKESAPMPIPATPKQSPVKEHHMSIASRLYKESGKSKPWKDCLREGADEYKKNKIISGIVL